MASDAQEKTLPATQHRLRKAREKGQVAQSQDFVSAAVIVGVVLWAVLRGPGLAATLAANIGRVIEATGRANPILDRSLLTSIFSTLAFEVGGLIGLCALAGIVANIAHKGGIVFSFTPIVPDFSRLDPAAGFTKLFDRRHWISFATGLVQLVVWFAVVGLIGWSLLPRLINTPFCGAACVIGTGGDALWWIGIAGLVAIVIAGLFDLPTQLALFQRDMRMSPRDRKQEHRETEGSPEMERHRRDIHRQALRAGSNTPTLIISSAQIAVALRYDPVTTPVPLIVGKGEGAAAMRILAAAERIGVPVFSDPALARRLIETARVGLEIPQGEFNAVAPHIVRSVDVRGNRP